VTQPVNWITVLIAVVAAVSVARGILRGTRGTARQLMHMVVHGLLSLLAIVATWLCVLRLSNALHEWLVARQIEVPVGEIAAWKTVYYTIVTGLRDFSLFRFAILFLIVYMLLSYLLNIVAAPVLAILGGGRNDRGSSGGASVLNAATGGLIGVVIGAARALMLIMALFVYVTMFPKSALADYIQASSLYQQGAKQVIEPVAGSFVADQLPVITRAAEQEFQSILQRKYEIVDANLPNDIVQAAKDVTAKGKTDEEKARLLYDWVGSRVQYDWEKVRLYEEEDIWKEQTPSDTFATRKGVCIDYSRLYAAMGRSVGLDVKVVTGLGYDGRGGYGSHAWNEVHLKEKDEWVPLDATWKSSGGNWFNPPNFDETHIRDV